MKSPLINNCSGMPCLQHHGCWNGKVFPVSGASPSPAPDWQAVTSDLGWTPWTPMLRTVSLVQVTQKFRDAETHFRELWWSRGGSGPSWRFPRLAGCRGGVHWWQCLGMTQSWADCFCSVPWPPPVFLTLLSSFLSVQWAFKLHPINSSFFCEIAWVKCTYHMT